MSNIKPHPTNKPAGPSSTKYSIFFFPRSVGILDGEALDLVAHGSDLASKLARVVAGDAGGDDGTADTAGTAKVHLAADVDVGDC